MTDQPQTDIATLFARDPEKMSEADIDAIIEAMRAKRHLFLSGPVKKTPALTKKEAEVTKDLSNLSLDLKL